MERLCGLCDRFIILEKCSCQGDLLTLYYRYSMRINNNE